MKGLFLKLCLLVFTVTSCESPEPGPVIAPAPAPVPAPAPAPEPDVEGDLFTMQLQGGATVILNFRSNVREKYSAAGIWWHGRYQGIFDTSREVLLRRYPGKDVSMQLDWYDLAGHETNRTDVILITCP